MSKNGPDFYNLLDRFWSNFGDHFGVKSCPKIGPKMDPGKSGPGRPPSGWKPDSSSTPAPGAGFGAGAGVNAVYKYLIQGL